MSIASVTGDTIYVKFTDMLKSRHELCHNWSADSSVIFRLC